MKKNNYSYIDKYSQNDLESFDKLYLSSKENDYMKIKEEYKDENLIFENNLEDNQSFFDKSSKFEYNDNKYFYYNENNEILNCKYFNLNDKDERIDFSRMLNIFDEGSLSNKSKNDSSLYLLVS